ncbi:LPP20 family lipoprotein [Geomonas azotofigens]|uniref:LPP20 family lipoprotein n=1 Tax=Geomonas azotofigens TaxID=2843196 RepID=UPI001C105859|nr:LPP20 family lipoprotein [Geomonas azotofigens]MBU5614489.1 LPP20 family lipoprotein [Geomonas azotofigens]
MFPKSCLRVARIFALCGITILLFCPVVLSNSVPKWFLSPPNNDAAYLYGSGHGATIEDATNEALNQIASKLSVTVGSTFEKTETVSSHNSIQSYDKNLSNNITTTVEKIKFNNYEIIKNSIEGKDVFVLVSVDKHKFVSEKIQDLQNADRFIKSTYELGAEKSIMEKVALYREITSKIAETYPLLGIIHTLSPAFDVDSYYLKFNKLSAEIKGTSSKLQVYLDYGQDSSELVAVVTKHLNNAAIVVVPTYDPNNKNLVTLNIRSSLKKLELYGAKVVKFNTDFEVKSTSDNTVAVAKIESKGSSAISFNEAYQAAAINLDKKIAERGIWAVLGIEKASR